MDERTVKERVQIYFHTAPDVRARSRELLLRAAAHRTGLSADALRVAVRDGGRPYLPDLPQLRFSVTHSGDVWMCAFCPGEVGLDLQAHRTCRRSKRLSSTSRG